MKRLRHILFIFLLLLSGFAGISYEILYARILGNIIGDQWAVSASILLTFLLGIGFGAFYAHRLWRYLWLIEAGISLYAIGFVLGTEAIEAWIYTGMKFTGAGLAGNVLQCTVLLGIPSFLIGSSLPLFAGYLSRIRPGLAFVRAYAIHSFGAALTVLIVEFWLLRLFGLQTAVLTFAAVNAFVSIMLFTRFRELRAYAPEVSGHVHFPKQRLLALWLVSVASAVFQLWMLKIAEFMIGPFRETFALVLGLVLLGIAVGSVLIRRFKFGFGLVLIANLIGLAWLLGGFNIAAELYARLYQSTSESYFMSVMLKLSALTVLMGLPAVTFGATIPALSTDQDNVARESGKLLFISSIGNAAGYLLMVFYLHQHISYGGMIIFIAVLTVIALIISAKGLKAATAGAAVFIVCVIALHHFFWSEQLLFVGYTSFDSRENLKKGIETLEFPETFKGPQDVFSLNRHKNGDVMFFINGYRSILLNEPAEKIVGAFSAVLAPRTDRALVLGTGSGITAGTVGLIFDQTDTVEINSAILENLSRMSDYNFNITNNPRVTIIHDDAMHYTKVNAQTYSLIINTVTSPLYFSSSKLYTHDFLQVIRRRLSPDGVYVTWADSRIGDRGMDITLKTLSQTFNQCWLGYIRAAYFLVACSPGEMAVHNPGAASDNKALSDLFWSEYKINPAMLSYHLLSTDVLSLVHDKSVPVNTLNYPSLEFEIAQLRERGLNNFMRLLIDDMSVAGIASEVRPAGNWDPLMLAVQADRLLGRSIIRDRWYTLLSQEMPDIDIRFNEARINYFAGHADKGIAADSYHELGYRMLTKNKFEEAVSQFQKALALDPKHDNSNLYIGESLEAMARFEEALQHYNQELSADQKDISACLGMGRIYMRTQRYKKALASFDEALKIGETADVQFFRGLALQELGDIPAARKSFERVLEIAPGYRDAQHALSML